MLSKWRVVILAVALLLIPSFVYAQTSQQTHIVAPGENLFRIALQYGLTVDQLATANNITDPTKIYVGQVLIIPGPGAPAAPANPTSAPPSQPNNPVNPNVPPPAVTSMYTVQIGDTLSIISRKFDVSLGALLAANPLTDPNNIIPGQQIVIPGANGPLPIAPPIQTAIPVTPVPTSTTSPVAQPTQPTAQPSSGRTYVVQPGQGLAEIGRMFGVSWPAIATMNNITDPNTIYAGMVLQIPDSNTAVTMNAQSNQPDSNVPAPPPADSGKRIVVILSQQRMYAYDNGKLVRNVLVSTGLPDSPTVQGDFNIYVKYTSQLMVGPGYYLPGVPWVMYFYEGYGLHGTYWHHNFGHPMSHGCVNLPTPEAEWLYGWADVGTPVHIQW